MSKRKWAKGRRIETLDDLTRQENIYWDPQAPNVRHIVNRGWFISWQLRYAQIQIANGHCYAVVPADKGGGEMRVNCKYYLGCRRVLIEEVRHIHYTTRDGEPYHKREERISEMRPAWFASCALYDEEEIGRYCGKGNCDAYKEINANRETKK